MTGETDEATMISTTEDSAAIHSLLVGCQAVVDEIKRLREDVTAPDRTAKLEALIGEFNRRVAELQTYVQLIGLPVITDEERKP